NVAGQQRGGILLDENLALEGAAIDFHVFVGIASVAIFAAKFAAAVGIDGPFKGNAIGVAAVEDGLHRETEGFGLMFGFAARCRGWRRGSEAGNANQRRFRAWRHSSGGARRLCLSRAGWRGAIRRSGLRAIAAGAGWERGKLSGRCLWAI